MQTATFFPATLLSCGARFSRAIALLSFISIISHGAVQAQTITVGNVAGAPGQSVWVDVTFDPQFVSVAGTLNTISFDPNNTPISTCEKNTELQKTLSQTRLPSPCGGSGEPQCNSIRVLIMDPIGDQPQAMLVPTVLYRCRVDIPSFAVGGGYPLTVSNASATDPASNRRAIVGVNGGVGVTSGGGGGCNVDGSQRSGLSLWILVGVLLALFRRSRPKIDHATVPGTALVFLVAIGAFLAKAEAQTCTGDCDSSREVSVDEIIRGVNIALGTLPLSACSAMDANGDTEVTVDEIISAVNRALEGCLGLPTFTRTFTPVVTNTFTPTPAVATPTPTQDSQLAQLIVQVNNPSDTAREVCLSGSMVMGATLDAASHYGCPPAPAPTPASGCAVRCQTVPANCSNCTAGQFDVRNLSPGEWLHRIHVSATGQVQYTRSLLVADSAAPNRLSQPWTVVKTVRTVTTGADSGTGSLRTAITDANAAAAATRPWLIRFGLPTGVNTVDLTSSTNLVLTAPGTTIDGTSAEGNPSPLADFASRIYPIRIRQMAPTSGGGASSCAAGGQCTIGQASTIRVNAANAQVVGLSIERTLASAETLCCGDIDVMAFGATSAGSALRVSRLDGGAATQTSATGADSATTPPQGKDCIDAEATNATASNPVVVENSEIRFCHDRGLKSKTGYLKVERNWIHNNLRGGLFAQVPSSGSVEGVIEAIGNLVEQSGINCPSGSTDLTQCGTQDLARPDAAEAAAQGNFSRLTTMGNIFRNGAKRGIYLPNHSKATIQNDFVCGINNGTNGQGIVVQQVNGLVDDIMVRGTAVVYNEDAGVRLEDSVAANFGSSTSPGQNAFSRNSASTDRNFRAVDTVMTAPAHGNQWQHCYPTSGPNQNDCDEAQVSNLDTNNVNHTPNQNDRVDIGPAQVHAGDSAAQPTSITSISPSKVTRGGIIRITGTGFNAIGGLATAPDTPGLPVNDDCTVDVNAGNGCSTLTGTCVEFNDGSGWRPAEQVLSVTPRQIVVRSPISCARPVEVRVKRKTLSGGEITAPQSSDPVSVRFNFCRNP